MFPTQKNFNYYFYRIASRTLLIPFNSPQVGPVDKKSAAAFSDLKVCLENSSSIVGSIVALRKDISEDQIKFFCGQVASVIGSVESRLVVGYAALIFFTNKVEYCRMSAFPNHI